MNFREEFLKTQEAAQFRSIVNMRAFEEATKTAMLVYSQQTCVTSADDKAAAANNFRLDGARQFLATLTGIANETPPRGKLKSAQLNHSA